MTGYIVIINLNDAPNVMTLGILMSSPIKSVFEQITHKNSHVNKYP